MKLLAMAASALLLSTAAWSAELPREDAVAGGIAVVPVPEQTDKAFYGGRRVMLVADDGHRYAIVGVPLETAPGEQSLTVETPAGQQTVNFRTSATSYPTQRITIDNESQVTLSAEALARVRKESERIHGVYDNWTPELYAKLPFALPVKGIQTSPFGAQRIINGKPRSPHSGIDIAAPAGTPVKAPADGVVAEVGNFFFNGNTVMINHGEGLVSVYVHLSDIKVTEGERVERGQVIAEVGSTGRTTGSDLHWTVTLNGAYVNPKLLLSQQALDALK